MPNANTLLASRESIDSITPLEGVPSFTGKIGENALTDLVELKQDQPPVGIYEMEVPRGVFGGEIDEILGLAEGDDVPKEMSRWKINDKRGEDSDLISFIDIENVHLEGLLLNGLLDKQQFKRVAYERIEALPDKSQASRIGELKLIVAELAEHKSGLTGFDTIRSVLFDVVAPFAEESDDIGLVRIEGDDSVQDHFYELIVVVDEFYDASDIERIGRMNLKQAMEYTKLAYLVGSYNTRGAITSKLFETFGEGLMSDELATELWSTTGFLESCGTYIADGIREGQGAKIETALEAKDRTFNRALESFGLSEQEAFDIRRSIFSYSEPGDKVAQAQEQARIVERLMSTMARMEHFAPGSVGYSHEIYGIHNFHRYSAIDLLRQYDEENTDINKEVQLVISALTDHNGGISNPRIFKGSKRTIFMEAGNKTDIAKRLLTAKKEFGVLSRLVFSAHGSMDGIQFSRGDGGRFRTRDVFNSKALSRFKHKGILRGDGDVIVASCSTGKKNGFTSKLAKKTGYKIIASERNSAPTIETSKDGSQKLEFIPADEDKQDTGFRRRVTFRLGRSSRSTSTLVYDGSDKVHRRDSYKL